MDPLDFNHREKSPLFADVVNARIDTALCAENSTREPRLYLGGSRLGESCARKLQYELLQVPRDPDREFSGKTLRIFAVGHMFEDLAVDWLTKAGYDLRTRNSSGGQFGFSVADGRVRGHIDGVIVAGPDDLAVPALWECKSANAKNWRDIVKKDSCELWHELVPFNAALAQTSSDKAVRILQACDAGDWLPRVASDPDHFECTWCDRKQGCWA